MSKKYTLTFTRQPGKCIYTLYTVLSTLAYLPLLLIYNLPNSLRPHPSWTYYQAVANYMTKVVLHCCSMIEIKTTRSLKPGRDASHFALMKPSFESFYRGPTQDTKIKPGPVGGIWLPAPYDKSRDGNRSVVLHFHGGAYVTLSPRSANVQWGPQTLVDELSTPVLLVNYRLASDTDGCFPAALQDAITAFKYLLDLGISPKRIVLSGDSSGANLVLALLRYISENEQESLLPCPLGATLWSPWVDMTRSTTDYEGHRNYRSDYLPASLAAWGLRAYVPPGHPPSGPYFSPVKHPFATEAKLFIELGTAELLADEIEDLAKMMGALAGNDAMLWRVQNAMHDTFAAGGDLGFEAEAREAVRRAGNFLGIRE